LTIKREGRARGQEDRESRESRSRCVIAARGSPRIANNVAAGNLRGPRSDTVREPEAAIIREQSSDCEAAAAAQGGA